MKRNEFIKAAAGACLACSGSAFLGGQKAKPPADKAERERLEREFEKRFKEEYIRTLMENMEKTVDPETRVRLMNDCGRACARGGGLYKLALDHKGNLKSFVQAAAERLGRENVRFLNATAIHWSYPRCFCELVAAGPARLPAIYCQCSVGWVLEMFETVLQKPIRVKLVQSIKSGASSCIFRVEPAPKG
jgi:hypothetical protein